jgi:hypothetical protein
MSRIALKVTALAAVIALLGAGSYAIAGGGSKSFKGSPLTGYEETPSTLSTTGTGSFTAKLSDDGDTLHYKLSYSGLEGNVTMAHVHFGARALSGGISFWLCETATNPSPSPTTPACPVPGGTVEGDITAAEVIGPLGQGIEPMAFNEIVAAMRAGRAYANVHSSKWPSGEIRAQVNDRGRHGNRGKGNDDD